MKKYNLMNKGIKTKLFMLSIIIMVSSFGGLAARAGIDLQALTKGLFVMAAPSFELQEGDGTVIFDSKTTPDRDTAIVTTVLNISNLEPGKTTSAAFKIKNTGTIDPNMSFTMYTGEVTHGHTGGTTSPAERIDVTVTANGLTPVKSNFVLHPGETISLGKLVGKDTVADLNFEFSCKSDPNEPTTNYNGDNEFIGDQFDTFLKINAKQPEIE